MKLLKSILLLSAALITVTSRSAVPEGYYDSLSGLNGSALRKAAKAKVRNHTVISYGDNTWNAFKQTDTRFVNGQNCWWDMYSYDNVTVASGHPGMNIEHSVANSWWGGTKNDAYKDLFHLNPSNSDANSRKSNYPLGEVATVKWTNGATTVGSPVSGQGGGNGYVYEPCDEYKGDFARVFMYMFTVYDDLNWDSSKGWMFDTSNVDIFKPWAIQLLLKWHRQDPVSEKEIARNEAIYKIQGNRNPYIDSPELAEYVWGTHKSEKYQYGGEYVPVDPEPPVVPDPPVVDPQPTDGEWIRVNSMADINAVDSYILVGLGANSNVAMSTGQSSNKAYFAPTADVTIAGDALVNPPANCAILSFTASGADYRATVRQADGVILGTLCSASVKTLNVADNPSAAGTSFSLSVNNGIASLTFDPKVGAIFYNESAPRFTTYTSNGQKPTALFRKSSTSTIVGAFETENPATTRIFTLQGMEIREPADNLLPGVYIFVAEGKQPRKIIIK
ncbi:MAG: endonuclease [Muribaculaceae bacterium]|nr:endonuclease [Muribaculaceae bacterium]